MMIEVTVTAMDPDEAPFAAGVVARGMRDNPMQRAAFGEDPLRRVRISERIFPPLLAMMNDPPLCARRGDWIVGVCGLARPGACQLGPLQSLRLMPALLRAGPGVLLRSLRWQREWTRRDPKERHWHLGPVAVEGGLQGMGIGSRMLERFCARVDDVGEVAYLETDRPENVRFYERFGFQTVEEAEVLGAPNWFMRRDPARR